MPQMRAHQQAFAPRFPTLQVPQWPSRLTGAGLATVAAGALLCGVSGPLNRSGIVDYRVALLVLAAGFFVTVIGTAAAIVGLLAAAAKRSPVPGALTVVGVVVGLALIGYLLSWLTRALSLPPIHDITTDPAHPPSFVAIVPLRKAARAVNSPRYVPQMRGPGGRTIHVPQLQERYYPDVRPLLLALPPAEALARARRDARALGWRIDAYVPADERLEATAETSFFGFKDDVVVRIRPSGTGSRVDVRSESRVGLGDFGADAARIRAFVQRMSEH